ncbi:type II toxin-antitoxin system VapC family toxin [Methanomethylovorans sp.]|uniref:type II toxin-antitoxin system VapC family toxin n=1 Tax=Methanomethylovorans sp. TaxID=2758717 RepID=UPI00351C2422
MNYLDSNLIIYAILDDTDLGEWARGVLEQVQNSQIKTCTSYLTFDEVYCKVNKEKGTDTAMKNITAFLCLTNLRFMEVNDLVIWKSLELIKEYGFLPGDAIHAASAIISGATAIISQENDFDRLKELKRKWIG